MSKLEAHSNNSHSVRTESGRKNIHVEVYNYIDGLEKQKELLLSLNERLLKGNDNSRLQDAIGKLEATVDNMEEELYQSYISSDNAIILKLTKQVKELKK